MLTLFYIKQVRKIEDSPMTSRGSDGKTEISRVALLVYLAGAVKERQHGPQRRMWYSAAAKEVKPVTCHVLRPRRGAK